LQTNNKQVLKVYFISGLGADRRVFSFLDLSFCEPVFIDWITPEAGETLSSYALRLRALMPEEAPVIVGLSLGGMLAAEIAKADSKAKAILISSNKTSQEFPTHLRVFKYIPLYKWMPGRMLKSLQSLYTFTFAVMDKQQKEMMYRVIADADIPFCRWAIGAVMHWDSTETAPNIIQIHGTKDKLLRMRYVKPDHIIPGGSHTMTLDKHAEVSALLKELTLRGDGR
jgi:pimeloyl-ACP methyl ester carboxylesterase